MSLLAFQWPNTLLVVVLIVLAIGVLVPWLDVIQRRSFFVLLLPAVLSTLLWQGYEFRIDQLAPVGDPLIRLDLGLIYPLLAVTWISTALAVGVAVRSKRALGSR